MYQLRIIRCGTITAFGVKRVKKNFAGERICKECRIFISTGNGRPAGVP